MPRKLDPYIEAKTDSDRREYMKQYQRVLRMREKEKEEAAIEEQIPMFDMPKRPENGAVCSVPGCGKVLYEHYERQWGKCLRHKHGGIIARREQKIHMTEAATRKHHRAVAGD
jgi:hypothetical protein